ncbi:MAG: LPXTG cell wall anchor domain-containing protein [Anaerolineae bacterium]|nr:LPXTG cell wall anchor domain-containing protein [Anaerolineae bacterium]
MSNVRKLFAWLLVALLVAVPTAFAQDSPSVTVSDQEIVADTVTVDEVISDGPGWIVIHAEQDGAPGPVIGWAAVEDGTNTDVSVEIETANATDELYAMLHIDAGVMGTYEFPGADVPAEVDGEVVVESFSISMLAQATATPEATAEAEATATPETLPETGGSSTPWTPILIGGLGLLLVLAGALLWSRRQAVDVRADDR